MLEPQNFPLLQRKASRQRVLVACIVASSMAFIDGTALNVALPSIQAALDLSGTQLIWIVNAYALMLAALTLSGGAIGDHFGKRKTLLYSTLLFAICSVGCGLATSGTTLIIARIFQGIAGAIMIPGSLSLLSVSYPKEERPAAIGSWSMFSAFTTLLGPVLGGYLAEIGWWRAIFFINLPLSLLCVILLYGLAEPSVPVKRPIDYKGALLITLGLSGLTYGFIQAGEVGFGHWEILISLIGGALLILLFVWWQARAKAPMMPLSIFKSHSFSGANLLSFFVYGALGSILFFVPINLIQIQAYSEKDAGLAMLPFAITIALLSRLAVNYTKAFGARLPLIVGPALTSFGFYLLSTIGQTTGSADYFSSFFTPLLLSGIGMGITVVPLTATVMNCVEDSETGMASGINNTVTRLSSVICLAILGSIVILYFQELQLDSLGESELSSSQVEAISQASHDLANAQAPNSLSESLQDKFAKQLSPNFLSVFNLLAYLSAGLAACAILFSLLMIRDKPRVVQLR